MAGAGVIALVLCTAASIGYSAYQAHEAKDDMEAKAKEAKKQEEIAESRGIIGMMMSAASGCTDMAIDKLALTNSLEEDKKTKGRGQYRPVEGTAQTLDTREGRSYGKTVTDSQEA